MLQNGGSTPTGRNLSSAGGGGGGGGGTNSAPGLYEQSFGSNRFASPAPAFSAKLQPGATLTSASYPANHHHTTVATGNQDVVLDEVTSPFSVTMSAPEAGVMPSGVRAAEELLVVAVEPVAAAAPTAAPSKEAAVTV